MLFRRFHFFPAIIVINDPFDLPVDTCRVVQITIAVAEDKTTHTTKLDYIFIAVKKP